MHRLITIPVSHYCEKARWTLDLLGEPYREDGHMPLVHWRYSMGAGGGRTVPIAQMEGGPLLTDSTDILEHVAARRPELGLYGESPQQAAEIRAWEERLDRSLGPAVRRAVYYWLMPEKRQLMGLFTQKTPRWEQRVFGVGYRLFIALMRRGMGIGSRGFARSEQRIHDVLAEVDAALADGRPYLVGSRFSAADLTLAALLVPFTLPPEFHLPIDLDSDLPAPLLARVVEVRARRAGAHVLAMYAAHRGPSSAVAG